MYRFSSHFLILSRLLALICVMFYFPTRSLIFLPLDKT
ncbi:hypothetical protein GTCCBUS3UF5_20270 [Geobacillus thermoleovorans CCB_US3_UF5]|uniref:Uncharacterized protein n=1 Tax=Geobacillus thermoleovorans CCB_US3_UF5 TaxID=1111068 RepID=A0ABN3ZVM8_GEOTH|nr:hypothetical protein GTCCBUS3UF5_20270 [Geobacillus thermoleovorans CCB_US3_UF5]